MIKVLCNRSVVFWMLSPFITCFVVPTLSGDVRLRLVLRNTFHDGCRHLVTVTTVPQSTFKIVTPLTWKGPSQTFPVRVTVSQEQKSLFGREPPSHLDVV